MITQKNIKQQEKVHKEQNFFEFNLTKSQLKVLKFLLSQKEHYKYVYPSIYYIAYKVGCSERTIHRAIQRLRECGLITWLSRKREKKTNMYFIPDYLLQPDTYRNLWDFIRISLSISLYFLFSNKAARENVILKEKGLLNSLSTIERDEEFTIENWLLPGEEIRELTPQERDMLKEWVYG